MKSAAGRRFIKTLDLSSEINITFSASNSLPELIHSGGRFGYFIFYFSVTFYFLFKSLTDFYSKSLLSVTYYYIHPDYPSKICKSCNLYGELHNSLARK